jgi:hypothetical protein
MSAAAASVSLGGKKELADLDAVILKKQVSSIEEIANLSHEYCMRLLRCVRDSYRGFCNQIILKDLLRADFFKEDLLESVLFFKGMQHNAITLLDPDMLTCCERAKVEVAKKGSPCAHPPCPRLLKAAQLCAWCQKVIYCSNKCQNAHWKTHKNECKAPS